MTTPPQIMTPQQFAHLTEERLRFSIDHPDPDMCGEGFSYELSTYEGLPRCISHIFVVSGRPVDPTKVLKVIWKDKILYEASLAALADAFDHKTFPRSGYIEHPFVQEPGRTLLFWASCKVQIEIHAVRWTQETTS